MKVLYIVLFLLVGLKPAISDSTLIFKNFSDETSRAHTYYLKDRQLRLLEEHSELFNIFDQSNQSFSSINTENGTTSIINSDILNQRVQALTQQRMKKLAELEAQLKIKLENKNDNEKKAGESVLNQLKHPELYGSHTLLKMHKTKQSKTINNINCDIYKLLHKATLVQKLCIADNQALKLNIEDYETLRDFQHFNYITQTSIFLATGKTDFTLVDFLEENINGIPVEIINTSGGSDKLAMMLINISRDKLDKSLFLPTKP